VPFYNLRVLGITLSVIVPVDWSKWWLLGATAFFAVTGRISFKDQRMSYILYYIEVLYRTQVNDFDLGWLYRWYNWCILEV
jgi:hypothetical protein